MEKTRNGQENYKRVNSRLKETPKVNLTHILLNFVVNPSGWENTQNLAKKTGLLPVL
jgi:hypothetical protein